jgi:hypothetical protein
MMYIKQCFQCVHFDRTPGELRCAAFDEIPDDLLDNSFDHRNPHPDDRGVQFKAAKGRQHPQEWTPD